MDAVAIASIAGAAVSLIVPFIKNIGESMTKKAGEAIGTKIGDSAWAKAKQLHDTVKAKLCSQPDSMKVISALEKTPDDADAQAAVRFHLKQLMILDENFARELAVMLREASETGVDAVFHTTVSGDVEKLVEIGAIYGNVEF
jgi:hypothetical protein